MGIEGRDWYRKDPPKGSVSAPPATSRGPGIRSGAFWVVLTAIAAVVISMWQTWIPGRSLLHRAGVDDPAKVVRVRLESGASAPARFAGGVCVTVAGQDRVCARYRVGEVPAERLRAALRAKGYEPRMLSR